MFRLSVIADAHVTFVGSYGSYPYVALTYNSAAHCRKLDIHMFHGEAKVHHNSTSISIHVRVDEPEGALTHSQKELVVRLTSLADFP